MVPDARLLPEVGYDEMLELASLGALILQPQAVEVAHLWSAPPRAVQLPGLPWYDCERGGRWEKAVSVTGVASDDNCAQITIIVPQEVNTLSWCLPAWLKKASMWI